MGRKSKKSKSADRRRVASAHGAIDARRQAEGRRYAARAAQAYAARRFAEAVDLYEKALERDPADSALLVGLARSHGMLLDHEATDRLLNKLIRREPASSRPHFVAGQTYELLGRFPDAATHFRKAAEAAPDSWQPQVFLARVLERLHQLEDARCAVDRALRLEPNADQALLAQATLDRRTGELDLAESRLRALLGRDSCSSKVRIETGYELGHVLDALGDYDGAMETLVAAKKIQALMASTALDRWRALAATTRRLFASLTPEHLVRWHEAGSRWPGQRLAALAGHPRSGTTLVEQVLDGHPQLISAEESTVMADVVADPLSHGVNSDFPMVDALDGASASAIEARRAAYLAGSEAFIGEPIGDRILLDKNPELTWLLPFVHRVFPEMKVLIALRDPRDVCLSCFMQSLPITVVSANWLSLKQTIERYALVMGAWLTIRPLIRSPWMEIRYEDTVQDLEGQARRMLEFLELPWDPEVLTFQERAKRKHIDNPSYEAVTRPVHSKSVGRWRNYERYLEPYLEVLEPFSREFGYE